MSTIADCPLSGCNLNSLHLPSGAVIIFLNAFGECHPLARLGPVRPESEATAYAPDGPE